mmetsp:Transcript_114466/g.199105  ORF Transcript_114466/g.199105 Transcript_114466/m.199105 type:complete len:98 (+) Transcript_114466:844-1137(+)
MCMKMQPSEVGPCQDAGRLSHTTHVISPFEEGPKSGLSLGTWGHKKMSSSSHKVICCNGLVVVVQSGQQFNGKWKRDIRRNIREQTFKTCAHNHVTW